MYYDDVRAVGTALFADGRTLKDAKRMLRELKREWKDERTRYLAGSLDAPAQEVLGSWLGTTSTYEPGLFHAFADPRIAKTNNSTERVNKQLKTLERRLSGSPRPGRRFTRNAPLHAIFVNMKLTPGERFIARRRPEELRLAKQFVEARARSNGIGQRARRDITGLAAKLRERWHSAITATPTPRTPSQPRSRGS